MPLSLRCLVSIFVTCRRGQFPCYEVCSSDSERGAFHDHCLDALPKELRCQGLPYPHQRRVDWKPSARTFAQHRFRNITIRCGLEHMWRNLLKTYRKGVRQKRGELRAYGPAPHGPYPASKPSLGTCGCRMLCSSIFSCLSYYNGLSMCIQCWSPWGGTFMFIGVLPRTAGVNWKAGRPMMEIHVNMHSRCHSADSSPIWPWRTEVGIPRGAPWKAHEKASCDMRNNKGPRCSRMLDRRQSLTLWPSSLYRLCKPCCRSKEKPISEVRCQSASSKGCWAFVAGTKISLDGLVRFVRCGIIRSWKNAEGKRSRIFLIFLPLACYSKDHPSGI